MLAAGQREFQPPVGPTPRTHSGKVDFSGVWQKAYVPDMTKDGKDQKGTAILPFTPWGEAEWKKYDAANGDYTGACLPFGMTRSVTTPWTNTRTFTLRPDWEMMEYSCEENNKSLWEGRIKVPKS